MCGHIHHPEIREIANPNGSILYLNSGDWIENLTSLEYNEGKWTLYKYNEDDITEGVNENDEEPGNKELFNSMLNEFNMMNQQ